MFQLLLRLRKILHEAVAIAELRDGELEPG
jgi:hypothetical protein